jgi:hypothetical protein
MRKTPADLVLLGGKIFYCPTGVMELQCVARTAKRRRCLKNVEDGQSTGWLTLRSTAGVITVYDLSFLEGSELTRWSEQHCTTHDLMETVDHEQPEWEKFDPAGAHAHMVTTLEELISKLTRHVNDGATEKWGHWNEPRCF